MAKARALRFIAFDLKNFEPSFVGFLRFVFDDVVLLSVFVLDDDHDREADEDDEDAGIVEPSKHHASLPRATTSYPAAIHVSVPFPFPAPTHSLSCVHIVSLGLHGTNLCDASSAKKSSRHAAYNASHARSHIGAPSDTPTLASHAAAHSTPDHASRHCSLNPFNCMCTTRVRTSFVCLESQHVFARYASQNVSPFPFDGFDPCRAYGANIDLDEHVALEKSTLAAVFTPPKPASSLTAPAIVADAMSTETNDIILTIVLVLVLVLTGVVVALGAVKPTSRGVNRRFARAASAVARDAACARRELM